MAEYVVRWEIDVTADDARDAAEQAWEMLRDPDSIANIFRVDGPDVDDQVIDLGSDS